MADIEKIRVGIVGGAGYTAGELLRLLICHPAVEIVWVNSASNAGNPLGDVHCGLEDCGLRFTDSTAMDEIDVLFLCCAHGDSRLFLDSHSVPEGVKVIDLSQDYRDESEGFVYGLPELQREKIKGCHRLANPGCFATAIQLSLLPVSAAGKLEGEVHVTGVTGSTGAGVKPARTTHFSWRNDNLSVYKPFTHQHLKEIKRTLSKLQPDAEPDLTFVPVRGDFARGIFVMTQFRTTLQADELKGLYEEYYAGHPFASVSGSPVDLKQAVNTNRARISIEKAGEKTLVTVAIDNLLKGASGQAVQNMNLMFGLPETLGLNLKPSAF